MGETDDPEALQRRASDDSLQKRESTGSGFAGAVSAVGSAVGVAVGSVEGPAMGASLQKRSGFGTCERDESSVIIVTEEGTGWCYYYPYATREDADKYFRARSWRIPRGSCIIAHMASSTKKCSAGVPLGRGAPSAGLLGRWEIRRSIRVGYHRQFPSQIPNLLDFSRRVFFFLQGRCVDLCRSAVITVQCVCVAYAALSRLHRLDAWMKTLRCEPMRLRDRQ